MKLKHEVKEFGPPPPQKKKKSKSFLQAIYNGKLSLSAKVTFKKPVEVFIFRNKENSLLQILCAVPALLHSIGDILTFSKCNEWS